MDDFNTLKTKLSADTFLQMNPLSTLVLVMRKAWTEGRATLLHLTVPCESATAATVDIRIDAPAALELTGTTTWHGRSRGVVQIAFTAHPNHTGDYAMRVRQTYSDGEIVNWSGSESSNTPAPVVHVGAAQNAARDRTVILLVAAAGVAAWLVLRRRRGDRV